MGKASKDKVRADNEMPLMNREMHITDLPKNKATEHVPHSNSSNSTRNSISSKVWQPLEPLS